MPPELGTVTAVAAGKLAIALLRSKFPEHEIYLHSYPQIGGVLISGAVVMWAIATSSWGPSMRDGELRLKLFLSCFCGAKRTSKLHPYKNWMMS